jgi:nickel-dependent lactate racemase
MVTVHAGARRRVRLAYGTTGLDVDVPADRAVVVAPRHRPAAADPAGLLRDALRSPVAGRRLRSLARSGMRVAISVCDITRPQPRAAMVGAILEELDGIVADRDVVILIATGTHRANTAAEIREMLGPIADRCEIVNHDARDDASLVDLGPIEDVPVLLARRWVEADLRITTGFVEPHFFAGFSGGPKMVAPGLAGLQTTLALHNARRIGDPRATWAIVDGNPVHDAVRAIAAATGVDFALDVLLNDEQRITAAFGGSILEMHAAARDAARIEAMQRVDRRFGLVVTTNSGYPLDQNLYQAVKGMSAAAVVVERGGTIVCAAECRDGLPDHGSYAALLASRDTPAELLRMIEAAPTTTPDQWQVQIQARVQSLARVLVKADGLTADAIRGAHLEPIDDVQATIDQWLAEHPGEPICLLPEGPQTIPDVSRLA